MQTERWRDPEEKSCDIKKQYWRNHYMSQKIQDACYINYHLEVNYVKITIFTTNRLLQKHTPDHPLVTVTEDDDVWVRLLTWLEALCCRRWGAVCSLKDVLTMTWTWCDEVAWRSLQSMGCSPTPRLNWEPRMKIFHLAFFAQWGWYYAL